MSGAIMPEPLAKPLMVTAAPSIAAPRVAPLGKVSVVMIARAACSQAPGESDATAAGSAATIFSPAGGSPMTPVEEMKTSRARQPTSRAMARAVSSTTARPRRPVKVFELPELTTRARALPPLRQARHHSTGAPAVSERVKTPAIAVPGSSTATMRSLLSL